MLTPRQIGLVQTSFLDVLPITDDAAGYFYRRLFELAPDTRTLFAEDLTEQGRKLFLMLATIVEALDRLDTVMPAARELARRHVVYGTRPAHYAAVGTALLATLAHGLGESFDAETQAAWRAVYAMLSDTMLSAVA